MKRFIITCLAAPDDKPLFDLVVYGADLGEAMLDEDDTTEHIERRLRERNMTIGDFAGFRLSRPPAVPHASADMVYVEKLRGRR